MQSLDEEFVRHADLPKRKAPRSVRVANFATDLLATAVLTYGVLLVMTQALPEVDIFAQGSIALPIAYLLTSAAYYFIDERWSGQTLGKLLTRSVVVTAHGSAPSTRQIAVRTLIRHIPLYPLFFAIGWRWHDEWSGVHVNSMNHEA